MITDNSIRWAKIECDCERCGYEIEQSCIGIGQMKLSETHFMIHFPTINQTEKRDRIVL